MAREDIAGAFDPARFAIRRLPVHVGRMAETPGVMPSCLDMLIKLPGEAVVLPPPYVDDLALREFLDKAFACEDDLLPGWRDRYHAYLTFDRRHVAAGKTHRNAGWHFDGMQGGRFPVKLPVCHQYVLSTHLPTEFSDHPTDAVWLDEMRHNWFQALGDQVPCDAPTVRAEPAEILLMTAYQLHRSPVAGPAEAGWRTFVRLDISLKQQDRLGNSRNPLLPTPWSFVPRDLPAGLSNPIRDSSWEGSSQFDGSGEGLSRGP